MGDITRAAIYAHPGFVSGKYTWLSPYLQNSGSAPGVNSIRLLPVMVLRPVIIAELACKITTIGAAQNCQLALYNADPATKLPTTVAASTGNITTASAVMVSAALSGGNVGLPAGLYWQAVNTSSSAAAFLCSHASSPVSSALIGSATLASIGTNPLVWTFAQAFGTWPDLTGQALVEVLTATAACLAIKPA